MSKEGSGLEMREDRDNEYHYVLTVGPQTQ